MESVLVSIKESLGGIEPNCTDFDGDLIFHINSVFPLLYQFGIGPEEGFSITDEHDNWEDFLDDPQIINLVKSYVSLKVKLLLFFNKYCKIFEPKSPFCPI
mgnify:CR=1 FL=1